MAKQQEEIKKYILRKIALDDEATISKTADNFGLSLDYVACRISELLSCGAIQEAQDKECGYQLMEQTIWAKVPLKEQNLEEDRLYEEYIEKELGKCNEAALKIWRYSCSEMLNNAIEHSEGKEICICVSTTCLYSRVIIVDDGVGVFQTLLSGNNKNPKTLQSHLLAYTSRIEKVGTMVCMSLENETERKLREVFDMYTDIDDGFVKTCIPIKEACINGEPVARSQARRICNRLDAFKEVILDFRDVEFMGQGFADELFRVYAVAHPQVILSPINMLPDVVRMIRHVGRGHMPENVKGM